MVAGLVRFAVRRSLRDTRHVQVVPRHRARGLVAAVYRQVERDFSMLAPPVALHSAAPEAMAAAWAILRETLLAPGKADRAGKEAVATGVSEANSCPYCVDVHGMTLAAIPAGESDREALEKWARVSATGPAGVPPFPPEQAPELIGVAVAFQYYNRVVNVFLRDSPFPSHVPESAKPQARKVLGGVLRPSGKTPQPGVSVELLPAAPVPEDLHWARPNALVADAFARAYAAAEAAGERSVPPAVRTLLHERLSTWDGQAPGLSRSWLEEAVTGLDEADRPAGRLALAIALASYQVDDALVEAFRTTAPGDDTLIELAAWASMAAARRISTWVAGPT
ncbi:carboxymuconolactone decarboxylase family protein [Amycolatopsis sp., V23-08]|uniref:Carboxymuconolactone decarboxylase family protein n=1 Tax=Amycolatopsis heterodermiae TaxID=3110235 RepID=A0ABU5RKX9_9PSEU|nr:carboxymuconolactone decarboxylase family protein [Amycolatopsis sp., V23-08]MEA5366953.1 carboxymuconolactone decarboxylase family protein [Amycolatopsis sp., V23-08]